MLLLFSSVSYSAQFHHQSGLIFSLAFTYRPIFATIYFIACHFARDTPVLQRRFSQYHHISIEFASKIIPSTDINMGLNYVHNTYAVPSRRSPHDDVKSLAAVNISLAHRRTPSHSPSIIRLSPCDLKPSEFDKHCSSIVPSLGHPPPFGFTQQLVRSHIACAEPRHSELLQLSRSSVPSLVQTAHPRSQKKACRILTSEATTSGEQS